MSVVIVILSHRSKKKLFYDKRRHDYHQKTRTLDFETGSNGLETSCSRQAKRPRDRVKDSPYLEHCEYEDVTVADWLNVESTIT